MQSEEHLDIAKWKKSEQKERCRCPTTETAVRKSGS